MPGAATYRSRRSDGGADFPPARLGTDGPTRHAVARIARRTWRVLRRARGDDLPRMSPKLPACALLVNRANERREGCELRSQPCRDQNISLIPNCACRGSRVPPAWPKLPEGVELVMVVAVAALPVFNVTLVGLRLVLTPTKFTRLRTLKTSNRSWAFTLWLNLMFL